MQNTHRFRALIGTVALLAGCASLFISTPPALAAPWDADLLLQIQQLQALIQNLQAQVNSQSFAPRVLGASIAIGARVQTTANLNVRSQHNTKGTLLCTQPSGALGTITQGPAGGSGYTWWYVDFDTSCDGWVVQDYLSTITVTAHSVTLSWNVSSDATSYNIYRGTVSGGSKTKVASGLTTTSWTDTDVTPGITYYYAMTGVNPYGESGYSSEISAVIPNP
jgi:hypothetical protein